MKGDGGGGTVNKGPIPDSYCGSMQWLFAERYLVYVVLRARRWKPRLERLSDRHFSDSSAAKGYEISTGHFTTSCSSAQSELSFLRW